jgi:hypothetical protein
LFRFRERRPDLNSLTKFVWVRDSEVLYQQFLAGAGKHLSEALDRVYSEFKTTRSEQQATFEKSVLVFAALALLQLGFLENIEVLGASLKGEALIAVMLLSSSYLSLKFGYSQSRASFARAILESHLRWLDPRSKVAWLAQRPLSTSGLGLYSTIFPWPKDLIAENRRGFAELAGFLLIIAGTMIGAVFSFAVIVGAMRAVLASRGYDLIAWAVVGTSAALYAASLLFPKHGHRKRRFEHYGLVHLLTRLEDKPKRKEIAHFRIWKAKERLRHRARRQTGMSPTTSNAP